MNSEIEIRIDNCRKDNYVHLDLSNLQLQKIPSLPYDIFNKVSVCILTENELSDINNIDHFKKLKVLDVGHNYLAHIKSLPQTLEEFVCPRNQLTDLSCILNCPHIERIDFTDNLITEIPPLSNLKIVYGAHNKLTHIKTMNSLQKLICHNNCVHQIDYCPELVYLDARNNMIAKIDSFPKLKQLYINNNKLTVLNNLCSLEYLECIHNYVEKIMYFENVFEILCDIYVDKEFVNISSKYKDRVDCIKQFNDKYCCIKMKK
jgi:Leucine-rich repeat (LRR) protein